MADYYNEIDSFACQWLRNLAGAGHIRQGYVDERSISHVGFSDILGRNPKQAHFFAGIGGWPLALRLAGWPEDVPVWTGSCPCQPFSTAGAKKGFDDDKHLWPDWFRLIRACRPPFIFGEQVASPDGLQWLDLVSADLEGEGYTVRAADLPAACVGAPHARQRLFFVAVANRERLERVYAHVHQERCLSETARRAAPGNVGNPDSLITGRDTGEVRGEEDAGEEERIQTRFFSHSPLPPGPVGPWANGEWLACRDGKHRLVEPGTFPLADGVPARVGRLRAYGNAIVPQVAAVFIRAVMESLEVCDGNADVRNPTL